MKPYHILQLMGAYATKFILGTPIEMEVVVDDNFGRASIWLHFECKAYPDLPFLNQNNTEGVRQELIDIANLFWRLTQNDLNNPFYEKFQSKFCISSQPLWQYSLYSANTLVREVEEYLDTAYELGIKVKDKIYVGGRELSKHEFRYEFAYSDWGKLFINRLKREDKLIIEVSKAVKQVDYLFDKIADATIKFYSPKVVQLCDGTLPPNKMTKELAGMKQDIAKLMKYSETLADFADKFLVVSKRITEDIQPKMQDMGYAVWHQRGNYVRAKHIG